LSKNSKTDDKKCKYGFKFKKNDDFEVKHNCGAVSVLGTLTDEMENREAEYYLQASVLKSEVCDWNILIENKNAIDISHDMSICITFASHLELIRSELDFGFYPLASPTPLI